MRSKRQFSYGLIVIVLTIWGFVVQRITKLKTKPKQETAHEQSPMSSTNSKIDWKNQTLNLNYIDPFDMEMRENQLKSTTKKQSEVSRNIILPIEDKKSKKETEADNYQEFVNWPILTIKGVISQNRGVRRFASVEFEGKQKVIGENEVLTEEFVVDSITQDSLYIRHKYEKKGYAIP